LEHATFAVMVAPSSLTPLPASRVRRAAVPLVSSVGGWYPRPRRGESVTLPCPSWYIKKMFEPDMPEPVPSATHWSDDGALIWK
jgi:hypothetical protein